MNKRPLLCIIFVSLSLVARSDSISLNIDQARECLRSSQPNPSESVNVLLLSRSPTPGNKESIAKSKIYQQQMAAISLLIAKKDPQDLDLLIPFLGYVSDPVYLVSATSHQKTLEESKAEYPVFAAMLDTPGAATHLQNYCLDTKNPDDYRMTAFWVLKSVDSEAFSKIVNQFNTQWDSGNSKIKHILEAVEKGPYVFDGIIRVGASENP